MRILHLVHQYVPEHVGGTELYTQSLAQAQSRRGDEVGVLAPWPHPAESPLQGVAESGVEVFRVPVGPRGGTAVFRSTFRHGRLSASVETVLESVQPEIVHIQHLMGVPLDVVRLFVERGIPFVVALHDYWYACANAQLLTNYDQTVCAGPDAQAINCGRCALARAGLAGLGSLAPLVAPIMGRRNDLLRDVLDQAAFIIAPNAFVRLTYEQLGLPAGRMVTVPWGMDLPAGLPEIRQRSVAAREQRSTRELRVGYVGSLSHQKGIHILIEAFNRLPIDNARLDIYGNPAVFPNYTGELWRQATHPGIRFGGLLPRAEVWKRLAEFDLLVLPTLWYEASPLTIDEAFAAGTPVVGSDIGALPSMIRDGVDGLLFPPGDAQALADLLQGLIDDPGRLPALREGIRRVKTMDEHAAEIAALYERAGRKEPAQT